MEKIDGSVFFDLKQNDFKDMKLSHFRKIEICKIFKFLFIYKKF